MTSTAFRHYDVDQSDFPIVITASTDTVRLPDLAPVSFRLQNVTTGEVTHKTLKFRDNGDNTSTLTVKAPDDPCNVVFAVQVRFPADNPADKPLHLGFSAASTQQLSDDIKPADVPIVFGNYVVQFRKVQIP